MKSFFYLIGGTSIAQLVIILASPILARVFTPEDFGSFAILTTIVYFLTAWSCLRLDFAMLSSKSSNELNWLLKNSIIILIVLTLLISLVLLLLYIFTGLYFEILIFIPLMVFLSGFFNILNNLTLKLQNTHLNASSKIMQSGGGAISQLILGIQGLGFKGMALGQILGFFYSVIYLIKNNFLVLSRILSVRNENYKLSNYKKYIVYDSIGASFSVIANHIPTLLITILLGKGFGGNYYMAYRVLMLPVAVISISLSQFIGSKYIEWKNAGVYNINLSKMLNLLSILVFIPSFLLIEFLPSIFSYVLGEQWSLAGEIASISIVWIAMKFIFDSLAITLSLDKGQRIGLFFQVFLTLTRISVIYIGWKLNLDELIIVKYFCVISLISYILGLSIIASIEKLNLNIFFISFLLGASSYYLNYLIRNEYIMSVTLILFYSILWIYLVKMNIKIAKEVLA